MKAALLEYQWRWMLHRDTSAIMEIERLSFDEPWSEAELMACLRERFTVGMVMQNPEGRIVGYCVYNLGNTRVEILNMAVHPGCRLLGYGREMLDAIYQKILPPKTRRMAVACVSENNLPAQLCFHSCGWRCVNILRDHYAPGSHGYLFSVRRPAE